MSDSKDGPSKQDTNSHLRNRAGPSYQPQELLINQSHDQLQLGPHCSNTNMSDSKDGPSKQDTNSQLRNRAGPSDQPQELLINQSHDQLQVNQGFQDDPNKAPASPAAVELKTQPNMAPEEEEEWIKAIKEKFGNIAGENRKIGYDEFKKALDVKEDIFAQSYFRLFDHDRTGEIDIGEFMQSLCTISHQSDTDKLRFLFHVFDTDGDGVIKPEELKTVLAACLSESSLKMSDEKMDGLVAALLRAADTDEDGGITFEALQAQFERYPMLLENLAVSPSNWLKLHKKPRKQPNKLKVLKKSVSYIANNNKPLLAFLVIHFITFAACFITAAVRNRESNGWFMLSRGCGMSLNYHCAMLALSMARRSLTFLRNTWLGPYLAVDDHVTIHKMLGVTTLVLGLTHSVAHLVNIGVKIAAGSALTYAQILFTRMSERGWFYGTAYPTGVGLALILIIIGTCSLPIVRKSGKFELFHYSHLLYIVFWGLLLVHGPMFWIWFLVPGSMFLLERIYSIVIYFRQKFDSKGFYTTKVNLLGSNVVHLVITRPESFTFHAGDYVFLRIPTISTWEWHPFSISSAPEHEGILWVHIRTLGNWTRRLYDFFDTGEYIKTKEELDAEASFDSFEIHSSRKETQPDPLRSMPSGGKSYSDRRKVFIEGPFGSAAVRMGDTNHAVLIAAGIGVTPFASILQSLLTQHRRARVKQADNQPRYSDSNNLKKIDFVWVNRKADDFYWFITLLTQLEVEETRQNDFDHFLDLHLYMTAAKSSSDLKGVGLQMALELVHQEANQDMITGLRTRTKPGRPNWKELFKTFKAEKKGRVHIYFCGAPALATIINNECDNFGFQFSLSL